MCHACGPKLELKQTPRAKPTGAWAADDKGDSDWKTSDQWPKPQGGRRRRWTKPTAEAESQTGADSLLAPLDETLTGENREALAQFMG
eukprot:625364-Pyramimonas_sp.AAC.1